MSLHRIAALTLALALSGPAAAFTGSGREAWAQAQKYLTGAGRMTPDEAEAIRGLSQRERLEKAIEHLLEAERQAGTSQETAQVARELGHAYNRVALIQADAKDFRGAAAGLAEAIRRSPSDAVLYWNQANFLFSSGDYWEAAQAFSKAKELGDAELKLKSGRALVQAYMKQAQSNDPNAYDYAIRELEAQSYEHPEDVEMLYLLGENYRLKGDGAKALAAWDRARALGPLSKGMEQRYEQLKSAQTIKVERQFAADASVHFKIEFEDKARGAELARKFLEMFEAAYDELGGKYGLRVDHTVHVTVYTDEQFVDATKVAWAAGMHSENQVTLRVSPRGTDKEYRNTIFHEYAHHLISCKASQKHVPQWLNEGLALLAEPALDASEFENLINAMLRKRRTYMPFSQISANFTSLPSELHVRIAYAQAFSLTAALVDRFGFDAVLNILKVLGTGQEFEESFQSVTRVSFKDFERQWFDQRLAAFDDPPAK